MRHTQNISGSILDFAFPRCLGFLFLFFAMLCFTVFKAGTNDCALIGRIGSYTCIGVGVGCYFAMLCFVLFKAGTNGCALIGRIGFYTCVGCYFAVLCFVLFKAGTNGCALIGTIGWNCTQTKSNNINNISIPILVVGCNYQKQVIRIVLMTDESIFSESCMGMKKIGGQMAPFLFTSTLDESWMWWIHKQYHSMLWESLLWGLYCSCVWGA